jgi:hypoxanthine phosphoribosyltransferase
VTDLRRIAEVRTRADRVFSASEIDAGLTVLATRVTTRCGASNPLLLGVMVGGVVPLGLLLTRLDFPLEVDYVHATRYGATTRGGDLHWVREPPARVAGRTVLVIDDVLDEGRTLSAVVERCRVLGAREVLTVVLVEKDRARTGIAHADFAALRCEDRYLIGYGLDYHGYLRNAPGIFALAAEHR